MLLSPQRPDKQERRGSHAGSETAERDKTDRDRETDTERERQRERERERESLGEDGASTPSSRAWSPPPSSRWPRRGAGSGRSGEPLPLCLSLSVSASVSVCLMPCLVPGEPRLRPRQRWPARSTDATGCAPQVCSASVSVSVSVSVSALPLFSVSLRVCLPGRGHILRSFRRRATQRRRRRRPRLGISSSACRCRRAWSLASKSPSH